MDFTNQTKNVENKKNEVIFLGFPITKFHPKKPDFYYLVQVGRLENKRMFHIFYFHIFFVAKFG
jgi:hypothetical protein